MFDIESLSMSLYVNLDCSKVRLVQFTGTMTVKASNAIGTNILSLFQNNKQHIKKTEYHLGLTESSERTK